MFETNEECQNGRKLDGQRPFGWPGMIFCFKATTFRGWAVAMLKCGTPSTTSFVGLRPMVHFVLALAGKGVLCACVSK